MLTLTRGQTGMRIFNSIIIVVSILFTCTLHAETTKESNPHEAVIQRSVTSFMEKNAVPGVALETFVNGKPYTYHFGYANKAKKIPITKQTIFEIGSITKLMTSLLLAQEIDYSRASLDDSAKKYLHQLGDDFRAITLKSLVTHTSGLPLNAPITIHSRHDLNDYFANWSTQTKPGTQWIYSNVGIGLLGFILEDLNDHTIDELYIKRIATPLGMQSMTLSAKEVEAQIAQGYGSSGQPVKPLSSTLLPAAYSVKASAEDMQRFLSAAIGLPGTPEKIFYPMRLTQTTFIALPDRLQGLGWQIHHINFRSKFSLLNAKDASQLGPVAVQDVEKPIFDGDTLIDKTGASNGFRSYIAVIPNKKSGLVILTNKYLPNAELVKLGREILFAMTKDIK